MYRILFSDCHHGKIAGDKELVRMVAAGIAWCFGCNDERHIVTFSQILRKAA